MKITYGGRLNEAAIIRDATEKENENWQKIVRSKLEDLADSLSLSNKHWNAWELEFIENTRNCLKNLMTWL